MKLTPRLEAQFKEYLLEMLKTNLTVVTDVKTESHYVGDMSEGGSLYKDSHTLNIKLVFDGEVISESFEYLS